LHSAVLDKGALKGVKLPVAGQVFDGFDVLAIDALGQDDARPLRFAVDYDGASTAMPVVAAILGARQPQLVAQYLEQCGFGADFYFYRLTVDVKSDALCFGWHGSLLTGSLRWVRLGYLTVRVHNVGQPLDPGKDAAQLSDAGNL